MIFRHENIMNLEDWEIAICTSGNLWRNFILRRWYENLVVKILVLSSENITLDWLLGSTRILEYDFDACLRKIMNDGSIINERLDFCWNPHVRVIRYPSWKASFSYRTNLRNLDGDSVFSNEHLVWTNWTALDMNGFLHNQVDYHWENKN